MPTSPERTRQRLQQPGELLLSPHYASYCYLGRVNCLIHIAPAAPGLPCTALCRARLEPSTIAYHTPNGHPVWTLRWSRCYLHEGTGPNIALPIRALCPTCYARYLTAQPRAHATQESSHE